MDEKEAEARPVMGTIFLVKFESSLVLKACGWDQLQSADELDFGYLVIHIMILDSDKC